jgi:hypothetical protein
MRETATAQIALGDDGVLVVRIRERAQQRPKDARENLDTALSEGRGRRRPLLVDITGSEPLDAETRHLYSGQTLVTGFTALALLVEASPLGIMMGNVYFRVARPGIPTHLFTDEARAVEWLKGYLE